MKRGLAIARSKCAWITCTKLATPAACASNQRASKIFLTAWKSHVSPFPSKSSDRSLLRVFNSKAAKSGCPVTFLLFASDAACDSLCAPRGLQMTRVPGFAAIPGAPPCCDQQAGEVGSPVGRPHKAAARPAVGAGAKSEREQLARRVACGEARDSQPRHPELPPNTPYRGEFKLKYRNEVDLGVRIRT
jgi:hypothetical protein